MSDLALLSLFVATPEQILASRKRTFPHWGRGLTENQYLARDAYLDIQEHALDGKMTTWVLAPRADPTTLDFKCACETYRRKALVRKEGSLSPEERISYGVASVFTPPAKRKNGYAHHMMSLLHWVLAPRDALSPFPASWGQPPPEVPGFGNASFSTLYSDVGEFYKIAGPAGADGGWVIRDPVATIWQVPKTNTPTILSGEGLRWLDEDGVEDIWKKDAELMQLDMTSSTSSKNLFTLLPHEGVGAFLIRRATFYLTGQPYKLPSKWGVCLSTPGASDMPQFTTWTLDVGSTPTTLIFTRLRATPTSFLLFLDAIFEAARECGAERVEVWNLPKELEEYAHSQGGKTAIRDEHLNAFKWYGPERDEDIEWLFNEKFCWC
ncbi:hypothetical protein BD410DRAFT_148606 [Rickenella mellea]|uniref:LYC1 C-terminal domain-containing protein n=1 Tax=Rickenella mellea TaxID=50990 RepID=A0A4Y7Q965_9AGAM|nr:hypothetical protein BD410DRAFT_148606 [Rickenella mellea]